MHVAFGRIHGMSTRKGQVVQLSEVLDEAKERASAKVKEKYGFEPSQQWPRSAVHGALMSSLPMTACWHFAISVIILERP